MADGTTTARAAAIEGFAAALGQLRDAAGRPSFRAMSGRSCAISHTTLHEAVQGNKLPSWGTTAEFVKACGGDPDDYRERWQQASRAVGSPVTGPTHRTPEPALVAVPPSAAHRPDEPDRTTEPAPVTPDAGQRPEPATRRPARHSVRRYAVAGVGAAVIAVGAGTAFSLSRRDQPPPSTTPQYSARDCPVRQSNPPAAPSTHRGDSVTFVRDITLDDCTRVRRGTSTEKVWRFRNTGSLTWRGYTLGRIDLPQHRGDCQTITDVPLGVTAPGQSVDATVTVTAPADPGFCFVHFKIMDASGAIAFPGSRPVNFQLIVD